MKHENILDEFWHRLEGGLGSGDSFALLCAQMGVSCHKMNRLLKDCVGYDGEKLVKCCKMNVPIRLL